MRGGAGQVERRRIARHLRCLDESLRGHRAAIRVGARVERDPAAVDVRGRADVAGAIARGDHRRPVEDHVRAQPIQGRRPRRIARDFQIQLRVAGDLALLRRVLENRRQVEPLDIDVAADAQVGRLQIAAEHPFDVARFRFQIDGHAQAFDQAVGFQIERRMQVVALDEAQVGALEFTGTAPADPGVDFQRLFAVVIGHKP